MLWSNSMRRDWTKSGLDLHLDLDSEPRGRRVALEQALRRAVRDGRLAPGVRLPATRVLAADLAVSRGTVTAAYEQLVAEGYLAARRGAGTVVAAVPAAHRDGLPAGEGAHTPQGPRHDLRPGRPDVTSFPVEEWLRAARRVLPRTEAAAFAIGDPRGHPALRAALAEYLGRTRGVVADPGTIVVTSGFMQAIGLLSGVLADAGCTAVAMEDPCVPIHREAVRRAGPRVVPLPVDGQRDDARPLRYRTARAAP
ncbi:aminotransferase class I and II [Murinocardiopsis flavida]|uniref:Aminotransferase class I and II n=1 Tax=Murinocardiopsis flavida TaxID=645275 RepID=A0A2P8DLC0_9ACTN|nr:PLP-dependent aminotransferase family protein [Murinocardiopsis flavida]PSK98010.1 aminotransferase class I and II [Murinocardiopsis flavida]